MARLRSDVDRAAPAPERTRARRVLDSITVSAKTIAFLRSFMRRHLSSHRLGRALRSVTGSGGAACHGGYTEFVEAIALNYPNRQRSCHRAMTALVVALLADAGLDLNAPELWQWADGIEATTELNDAVEAAGVRLAERQLRLVVSLHGSVAGDWPESLQIWLLLGRDRY